MIRAAVSLSLLLRTAGVGAAATPLRAEQGVLLAERSVGAQSVSVLHRDTLVQPSLNSMDEHDLEILDSTITRRVSVLVLGDTLAREMMARFCELASYIQHRTDELHVLVAFGWWEHNELVRLVDGKFVAVGEKSESFKAEQDQFILTKLAELGGEKIWRGLEQDDKDEVLEVFGDAEGGKSVDEIETRWDEIRRSVVILKGREEDFRRCPALPDGRLKRDATKMDVLGTLKGICADGKCAANPTAVSFMMFSHGSVKKYDGDGPTDGDGRALYAADDNAGWMQQLYKDKKTGKLHNIYMEDVAAAFSDLYQRGVKAMLFVAKACYSGGMIEGLDNAIRIDLDQALSKPATSTRARLFAISSQDKSRPGYEPYILNASIIKTALEDDQFCGSKKGTAMDFYLKLRKDTVKFVAEKIEELGYNVNDESMTKLKNDLSEDRSTTPVADSPVASIAPVDFVPQHAGGGGDIPMTAFFK